MMSKLLIVLTAAAAFVYAAWLVALRRPLPDPRAASGLRRRFLFAVLIFAAALAGCRKGPGPDATCYSMVYVPPTQTEPNAVMTLRSVWLTLDEKQSDLFNKKLDAAVSAGSLNRGAADILAVAYSNLAEHKYRTRGEGRMMTCYKPSYLGGQLHTSREEALKQLELLEKFRASGTIDADTVARAQSVLARDFELFYQAKDLPAAGNEAATRLIENYKQGGPAPSADARAAASVAIDLERAK